MLLLNSSPDDPNLIAIVDVSVSSICLHQLEVAGVRGQPPYQLPFLLVLKAPVHDSAVLVWNRAALTLDVVAHHLVLSMMDMYCYGLAVFHRGDAYEFLSGAAVFIKACVIISVVTT